MGHRSASRRSDSVDEDSRRNERRRAIMVVGGIALFVAGFLVTVAAVDDGNDATASNSLPDEKGNSSDPTSQHIYLASGIMTSLVGVVLATVGPVAGMFKVSD